MQPYQQRVVQEKKDLDDKCEKLDSFLASTPFDQISLAERNLLRTQLMVMALYSEVLDQRIALF